ncbi:GYD domain-containing protein [Litoricolaceae bacterium]|nr:GYD domain-containing protein [Litorivicinaceae bacterium]
MAQFMVTAAYTASAFAGMANNSHNREEAIGKILSALNMNLDSLHMTLGGKLFMVVSGSAEAAGSLMIVAGASGSVTDITVDEVFSAADQVDWMQSASAVMGAYRPANA